MPTKCLKLSPTQKMWRCSSQGTQARRPADLGSRPLPRTPHSCNPQGPAPRDAVHPEGQASAAMPSDALDTGLEFLCLYASKGCGLQVHPCQCMDVCGHLLPHAMLESDNHLRGFGMYGGHPLSCFAAQKIRCTNTESTFTHGQSLSSMITHRRRSGTAKTGSDALCSCSVAIFLQLTTRLRCYRL